jgi:aldehyde:ferredoxin oxidoreductase
MMFLKINMTTQSVNVEDVPHEYMGLGGRGLTSIMINAEVPPKCDLLGPKNKLIFAPGLLSGTNLVNTSRISVGAKSPQLQRHKRHLRWLGEDQWRDYGTSHPRPWR